LSLHLTLKPKERIYINGAVLRFDRKTSLEFLNDVQFLMEAHIMQFEQATTPLRKLYYLVQCRMMEPNNDAAWMHNYESQLADIRLRSADLETHEAVDRVNGLVACGRRHEALKVLRKMFEPETEQ